VLERVGLGKRLERIPQVIRHAYLLIVVMIGWVFFRAETLSSARSILAAMAGFGGLMPTAYSPAWYLTPEVIVALSAAVVGATPIVSLFAQWRDTLSRSEPTRALAWDAAGVVTLVIVLIGSIAQSAAGTYNPFIYFRF